MQNYRNFSARLTEEEHRRMRTAAALADISMKEIIIRGLEKVEAELEEKKKTNQHPERTAK